MQAVYYLATSNGSAAGLAARSFDAVMLQQGINVQSQLLGARVRLQRTYFFFLFFIFRVSD